MIYWHGIEGQTPCERLNYDSGDEFTVIVEFKRFKMGDIVILLEDDGTTAPMFYLKSDINIIHPMYIGKPTSGEIEVEPLNRTGPIFIGVDYGKDEKTVYVAEYENGFHEVDQSIINDNITPEQVAAITAPKVEKPFICGTIKRAFRLPSPGDIK